MCLVCLGGQQQQKQQPARYTSCLGPSARPSSFSSPQSLPSRQPSVIPVKADISVCTRNIDPPVDPLATSSCTRSGNKETGALSLGRTSLLSVTTNHERLQPGLLAQQPAAALPAANLPQRPSAVHQGFDHIIAEDSGSKLLCPEGQACCRRV